MPDVTEIGGDDERTSVRPRSRRRNEDKRCEPRFRTRLRSGQLYDKENNFISICILRDRSTRGARLAVPRHVYLPPEFLFFDDELKTVSRVQLRWRRGDELGILIVALQPKFARQ